MNVGTISDVCVLVGGKLPLLGVRVILLEADFGDVDVHGKSTGAFGVLPLEIYAVVQTTLPVLSDIIVFFEGILKMVGKGVTYVFNSKVVDDDTEDNMAPFVSPKTRRGGAMVVSVLG